MSTTDLQARLGGGALLLLLSRAPGGGDLFFVLGLVLWASCWRVTSGVHVGGLTSRWAIDVTAAGLVASGYSVARVFAGHDRGAAVARGSSLLHAERVLHAAPELALNGWAVRTPLVFSVCMVVYLLGHFVVTPLVLVRCYRSGRDDYVRAGLLLLCVSLAGLVVFWLLPTAPPWMLPGFVGSASNRAAGGVVNQLAAMPSMHAAWSVWVALTGRAAGWRRWVWLYPLAIGFSVVATANHYLLDVVAGVLLPVLVMGVARAYRRAVHRFGRVDRLAVLPALDATSERAA